MAITYTDNGGGAPNGSDKEFTYTFPIIQTEDVKVALNGVTQATTKYTVDNVSNPTKITFNTTNPTSGLQVTSGTNQGAPLSGVRVRVYRETTVGTANGDENPKAVFAAGSSIRATDLNANQEQSLMAIHELQDRPIETEDIQNDAITGDKIADDQINSEHYVDGSIDTQHIGDAQVTRAKIEDDAVDETKITTNAVLTANINNSAVTSTKIADNAVTTTEILNGSVTRAKLAADAIDETKIASNSILTAKINDGAVTTVKIAADAIDGTKLADNAVNSEHYTDGSIDRVHLAADIVDGTKIADDSVNSEHIAAGALDNEHYAAGSITADKLNGATVVTNSEQAASTPNDTSFFTTAAAEARYFNVSSGETIKDGDTFPDNDTTIATTAAINDRIIDIVNDVGGFDIIQSEQHFPNTNPQGQAGSAAVLSIKAASTNLVPSGTTVTIVNGNIANNANITITGVTSTIPSGFGFIVESTNTLHEYAFHRLVPNATEVTTVAGKATEIGRLGTADAVADMAILGTADVVADMNTLATADIVSDMNTLAVADVISDMNTLAVADVISDMDVVATNVTNVNNVGNNITNVNNLTNSTGANQTFTVTVQNVSGNKYFIDGVQTPVLKLARGKTYTFNLADSSNSGHPLAFRDSSDNAYTTGVTTSGTAGSSGATVVIVVAANAPNSLKYYCTSHGNAMGNTINVIDDNVGAVAGALTNVNNVGGSIGNVNTTASSISNVNTVATNINNINDFSDKYRVGANNPTTGLDTGDLFFNTTSDSLKVYTGSAWVDGVTATGNFAVVTGNTFTGSNNHNDNVKSIYGTGSDLEIYHSGSTSFIKDVGTGNLEIWGDGNVHIKSGDGTETKATFDTNGSVDLYYDNSKKFETTSAGVQVTGNLSFSDNGKASFGNSGDLQIFHNGSNSLINDLGTGGVIIAASKTNIMNAAAGENMAVFNDNGSVELYHDGTKKLETDSTGTIFSDDIFLGDGLKANFGASADLQIYHSGSQSIITDTAHPVFLKGNQVHIQSANGNMFSGYQDAQVELFHNENKKFATTSTGVDVTGNITVSGTVDGVDIAALNTTVGNITTDVVTDTTPQLGGSLQSNGHNIDFADNNFARFGTGNDLQIYHNGTDSVIDNGTNNLEIVTQNHMLFKVADAELAIVCNKHGGVDLYHDNTKKFETTSSGVQAARYSFDSANYITCNTTANTMEFVSNSTDIGEFSPSGLMLRDSKELRLGTGNDLRLYHDGSHSYIKDKGTGHLYISASAKVQIDGDNDETMAAFNENGAVDLYYDNSLKFSTVSAGVEIHGNLQMDDDKVAKFGTGGDMEIFHDGSSSFVRDVGTGSLKITSNGTGIDLQKGSSETMARFLVDGAVELYYDDVLRLFTRSNGITVQGNSSAAGIDMRTDTTHRGTVYANNGNQIGFLDENGSWHVNFDRGSNSFIYSHFLPSSDSYNLGSASYRWGNVYTNDLHLSNEGHTNDVDGTWGDYTIQEGESDLFLKNNRSGKKYKFNLTEVS